MTNEQFARWKDFSLRMARTCYRTSRRPTGEWVLSVVQDFFEMIDPPEIECAVSWDHSKDYPKSRRPGSLVCDHVAEFLDEYIPCYPDCWVCSEYHREGECRCDDVRDKFYEQWDRQFGGPVHCCIRAGIDCASEPSAGVVGFTAGDVRRMFPEGVPDWVFPPGERLHYWLSDEINGTFEELPDSAGVVL